MFIDDVIETKDLVAVDLLEEFLAEAHGHFSAVVLGRGDNIAAVMHALYDLNRHLQSNHFDQFSNGFFAGNEDEVHYFVGQLLTDLFRNRVR